jgi:molecular chaperone Hsp33
MKTDLLTRFILDELSIRGEFVVLHKTTHDILSKQNYPADIRILLGQMTCASLLLSGTLKFQGNTSIQAKGSGPLTSIMAEATHQQTCRGIAIWRSQDKQFPDNEAAARNNEQNQSAAVNLRALLGKEATLAITLTPLQNQRYQGIVSLEQDNLADCLESYFVHSEQLNTMIRLFQSGEYWGGLLLQQLPAQQDAEEFKEHWQKITLLSATLSFAEMLDVDQQTILHRLFHEYDVRILQDSPTQFWCSCSEERTLAAIHSLGKKEAYAILAEQGAIDIDCQFCKQHYRFEKEKIDQLFDNPTLH